MSPEEIAQRFPEAVAFARQFRDVFGPGVRLIYARNQRGEELGRLERFADAGRYVTAA
jgi:hypothetical protein